MKAEEASNHCPPWWTGVTAAARLSSGVPSEEGMRVSQYSLHWGKVQLDVGKTLHKKNVCAVGQGPARWWHLHLWRSSKVAWARPWAVWPDSVVSPAWSRKLDQRPLEVPANRSSVVWGFDDQHWNVSSPWIPASIHVLKDYHFNGELSVSTLLAGEVDVLPSSFWLRKICFHLLAISWFCSVTRVERHRGFANVCRSLISRKAALSPPSLSKCVSLRSWALRDGSAHPTVVFCSSFSFLLNAS